MGSTFTLYCATMLSLALLKGQFQRICKGIGLQEIWNPVDCIIFIQGTSDMQHSVLKILRWYCILFGLIVNFDKSEVFSIVSLLNIVLTVLNLLNIVNFDKSEAFFYPMTSEHSINPVLDLKLAW